MCVCFLLSRSADQRIFICSITGIRMGMVVSSGFRKSVAVVRVNMLRGFRETADQPTRDVIAVTVMDMDDVIGLTAHVIAGRIPADVGMHMDTQRTGGTNQFRKWAGLDITRFGMLVGFQTAECILLLCNRRKNHCISGAEHDKYCCYAGKALPGAMAAVPLDIPLSNPMKF